MKRVVLAVLTFNLIICSAMMIYTNAVAKDELRVVLKFLIWVIPILFVVGMIVVLVVFTLMLREKLLRLQAKRKKAQAKSQYTAITAGPFDQVFVRETNQKASWTPVHLRIDNPEQSQLYLERLWAAGSKAPAAPKIIEGQVPFLTEPAPLWPQRVDLLDHLPADGRGDLDNIVLGVTLDQTTGAQSTVKVPLYDMVHVSIGGETGTGKSTLAYSIVYQAITASNESVQLLLADPGHTTWKTLENQKQLLLPVIGSDTDFKYALTQLGEIIEYRTGELFAKFPTVEKLPDYNRLVPPDSVLPYILFAIDEFPDYMADKELQKMLKGVIRKSRKAGVYILGMGTSWKEKDFDTSIRNATRTRFHYAAASPSSSRVLLDDGRAADLKNMGRAWARLPFTTSPDLVEIQSVFLDKATAASRLNILNTQEHAAPPQPSVAEQAALDALSQNASKNAAYRQYYQASEGTPWPKGQRLGSQHTRLIDEIVAKFGLNPA